MSSFDKLYPLPDHIRMGEGTGNLDGDRHFSLEPTMAEESYILKITETDVHITGGSPLAHQRALATLEQLKIIESGHEKLPVCIIEDQPRFKVRGYMLDISRGRLPSRDDLRELVDLLWRYKYNQLQLYMEHTFAYQEHELVWKDGGALTCEDIRWLDTCCLEKGIELVPNQNCFGHFENWLKHERYRYLAESPNGFLHPIAGWKSSGSVLYPDDRSAGFIHSLLRELLPAFSSRQVHIGCDEPWELGRGRSASLGKSRKQLFEDHLLRLIRVVEDLNHKPQVWADVLFDEGIVDLPKDSFLPVVWGYEADHPFEDQFAQLKSKGYNFLAAPGTCTWNSFAGRWHTTLANIANATSAACKFDADGFLLTDWGDNGHQQAPFASLSPILACANSGWNGRLDEDEVEWALTTFETSSVELTNAIKSLGTIDTLTDATRLNGSGWFYHEHGLQLKGISHYFPTKENVEIVKNILRKIDSDLCKLENVGKKNQELRNKVMEFKDVMMTAIVNNFS